MNLTRVAIQRPVFILMLMVATLLMGRQAYQSMRVELNPDVAFGVVTVTTVYPGAGPDEVNTLVSRKIEESVSSVAGLLEVNATSQEGVSSVALQFEVGTNMDAALNEVRSKVDTVTGQLPDEVEKPIVSKVDFNAEPVLTLVLKSTSLSNRQLRDLADNILKDRLSRIAGVASVGVSGGEEREIQVQVRRDALLRYRIGIGDVQRAIQAAALNVPSGRIVAGEEEFTVRVLGEFRRVEEVGDMFVTIQDNSQGPNGEKKIVQLKQIATIVDANAERRQFSRLDGLDSVVMVVQKAKEGNAVEISKAIRKPAVGLKESLLEILEKQYGVEFIVSRDTSTQIEESLFDLQFTLFFGILLVTAVVWLFLHNFRGTLIVALAIPICIFATFIAMKAFGFTINNLSMLALSLAIGVLVDDAIVVIENIYRHLTMGEDPAEAALNGRAEIGLAAIAITLADVVVFVPIGFMGGVVGQFFKPLGIGFAVCVLFSLFVSFTVTPMLASRWYRKGEDWEEPHGRFSKWFEAGFRRLADRYRNLLRWSLNHRWYVFGGGFAALGGLVMFIGGSFAKDVPGAVTTGMGLALVAVIIGLAVVLGNLFVKRQFLPQLILSTIVFAAIFPLGAVAGFKYGQWKGEQVFKFQFMPMSDSGQVDIAIELPPGANLDATLAVAERVERIAMQHPEAKYTVANIGSKGGGFQAANRGTNIAQVTVTLNDKEALLDRIAFWKKHDEKLRRVSDNDVVADMIKSIGRIPGAKIIVAVGQNQGFGAPIQLSFRSDDREKLVSTAVKVRDMLASGKIKGVLSPDISSKPGKPELRAIPDRARLADAGLTVSDVAAAMRTMYEGDDRAKFRVGGREYDIRVMMDLEDRDNPNILGDLPIAFKEGKPIFLEEVSTIQRTQGVDKINRKDRQEEVQISAQLSPGFAAGSVQTEIDRVLKEQKMLPEGVSYSPLGQAQVQARESGYLFGALGLGFILVYMVLASLYDNLLYPLIIQLAQPQAMIGALLALIITDKALNIVGMIGLITLVGLVGKNAILLVDYTNTLRERGVDRYEALVESGGTRLRPILMTTIAILVGMLPVALAIGRGSEFRETIGITIIGGVVLSTLLTLLVIPCSYSIFDDASVALGKFMRRFTKRDSEPAA